MALNSTYGLTDRGTQFVDLVRDTAGDAAAEAVAQEVNAARRANGTIDAARLPRSGRSAGPTQLLGSILAVSRIHTEVWATVTSFGMFEKKKAARTVGELHDNEGPDAAVDWAIANASKGKPSISSLQESWDYAPFEGQVDEDFYRQEIVRLTRSWKR